MSGFNPLAALGAEAVAAAGQAMAQATLDLGLANEVLQAQLSVGQVIPATILTPEDGSDLLSILGQTVVAQLPQGVYPGETLALQVTGFQGNQIQVLNLGTVETQDALPAAVTPPAAPDESAAPQQATLQTVLAPASSAPATASTPPPATSPALPQPAQVAPPRELFVAASVQPAPPPAGAASGASSSSRPAPPAPAVAASEPDETAPAAGASEQFDLDARIATAWASSAAGGTPRPAAPATVPTIVPRSATSSANLPRSASIPAAFTASSLSAPSSPAALLMRLGVPVTTLTLAASRAIGQAAQTIPRAFARLDAALAQLPPGNPQIPSLRAMLAFAGTLDAANARALPEQLASFVSNVLDGAESKLVSMFRALSPPAEEAAAPAPVPGQPASSAAAQTPSPSAQAQVAERTAAIDFDVKSVILALAQSPPQGSTPELAQALGSALTAITALQLGALNAQSLDPQSMVITLPLFYHQDGAPAQVRISRDGSNKKPLDADNFHVAFILDTKSLGTLAIDLQSVGRSVSVNLKTEGATAANRVRSTLGDLRARLEQLRYRVAAIGADVAPPRALTPVAVPAVARADALEPRANVDLQA